MRMDVQIALFSKQSSAHFTHLLEVIFHVGEHTLLAAGTVEGPGWTDKQPGEGVCVGGEGLNTTKHLCSFQTISAHFSSF